MSRARRDEKHIRQCAQRVKAARIEKGFKTAAAAARTLGINEPTYVHHENGTWEFGREAATEYASKFEVSVVDLMGIAEPDNQKQRFGARLTIAREAADMTLDDIGTRLGITPQAVQQWERGSRSQV